MDDNNEIEELEIGLEVDNSELKDSIDEAKDIIKQGIKEIENVLENADLGSSLSDSLTKNIEQAIDKAVKNVSKNTGTVDIKANVTTGDKTQSHSKSMQSDKPKSSSGSGLGSASGAINVAAASNMTKASNTMKGASGDINKGADKIDGSGNTFKKTGETLGTTTGVLGKTTEKLGTANTSLESAVGTLGDSTNKLGDANKSLGDASGELRNTTGKLGKANSVLESSGKSLGNSVKTASGELGTTTGKLGETNKSLGDTTGKLDGANTSLGTTTNKLNSANVTLGDTTGKLGKANSVLESSGKSLGDSVKSSTNELGKVNTSLGESSDKLVGANTSLDGTTVKLNSANVTLGNTTGKLGTANSILQSSGEKLGSSVKTASGELDKTNTSLGGTTNKLGDVNTKIGNASDRLTNSGKTYTSSSIKFEKSTGDFDSSIKELIVAINKLSDLKISEQYNKEFETLNKRLTGLFKSMDTDVKKGAPKGLKDYDGKVKTVNDLKGLYDNAVAKYDAEVAKGSILPREDTEAFIKGCKSTIDLLENTMLKSYKGLISVDGTKSIRMPESDFGFLQEYIDANKKDKLKFDVNDNTKRSKRLNEIVGQGNSNKKNAIDDPAWENLKDDKSSPNKVTGIKFNRDSQNISKNFDMKDFFRSYLGYKLDQVEEMNKAVETPDVDVEPVTKQEPDNGKDTPDNLEETPTSVKIVKNAKEIAQEKKELQDNCKNLNKALEQAKDNTNKLTKDDFPSEAKVAGGIEDSPDDSDTNKSLTQKITDRRGMFSNQSDYKKTGPKITDRQGLFGSPKPEEPVQDNPVTTESPKILKSLIEPNPEIDEDVAKALAEDTRQYEEALAEQDEALHKSLQAREKEVNAYLDREEEATYNALKAEQEAREEALAEQDEELYKALKLKEELNIPTELAINTEQVEKAVDEVQQLEDNLKETQPLLALPAPEERKSRKIQPDVPDYGVIELPAPAEVEVDAEQAKQELDSIKTRIKDFISNIGVAKGELGNLMKIDGANGFNVISQNIQSGIKSGVKGIKGLLNEIDSNNALKKLADDAKDAEERMDYLKERAEELNNTDTDKVEKEVEDVGKAAEGSALKLSDLINELKGYAGAYFGFEAIKSGITNAMQSIEVASTSASVFGDKLEEMNSWLREQNDLYGLSYERTQQFTTSITQMGKTMGMSTGEAMTLSQRMAQIAEQASRFYNVEIDTVYDDMKDAVVGSYDALEKYGIILDEETVANYANANSLTKTQQAMEMSKLLAEQLGVSEDYLSESMKRPAVQASILRDNLGALSTALGRCFMPIVTVVLPLLNTLASALTTTLNNIANFISSVFGAFGVKVQGAASAVAQSVGGIGASLGDLGDAGGTGAAADGLDGVGESASGAAKEVEKLKGLMGFDEIQTIKTQQDPASGGSGGGSGSGGGGGVGAGGVGAGSGDTDDSVSNGLKQSEEEINDWANRVGEALKAGWMSVGDYVNKSLESLKAAFAKLGTAVSDFCVGAWENGGSELLAAIGAFAGSVAGAVMDIVGQVVDAIANTINYLNPETNKFTAGFIGALTNAFLKVGELVRSLGGYFRTFLNNGGQAFLNVMGDIVMLVGTILAQVIADAASLVKAFFDSWAGQVIISTVAITLDIIAGAIKAVLIVINECLPVIEALGIAFGALKLIQISQDFTKVWSAISAGASPINAMTTTGGKLATKLGMLKAKALLSKDALKKFVKDGVKGAIDSMGKLIQGTMKVTAQIGKSFLKAIASATTNVIKFGKNLITHPIKTMKDFGTAIADNVKKLGKWAKELAVNAWNGVKKLIGSVVTAIAQMLGLSVANTTTAASTTALAAAEGTATAATGGLTAGAWLLQAALSALGIGLIVGAIYLLIEAVKHWDDWTAKVTEKCGWLGAAMKAVGDVCKWAWGAIKSFFGFEGGENNIEEETNETEDELNGLGDTIEEVSDRFGTSCSAINESLASIGIDGNKLALQLDEYAGRFDETFNRLSEGAQEYVRAIREGNDEALAEMGDKTEEYAGEVKYTWDKMSHEERAIFVETYGYFEGVTDDWLDYSKYSYEDAAMAFSASLKEMEGRQGLSSQELDRLQAEETENFKAYRDEYLKIVDENLAAIENAEGISEEQRYLDSLYWLNEKAAIEGKTTDEIIDNIKNQEDAVKTSADVQKESYEGIAEEQTKALETVDTALENTKTKLQELKDESALKATEIPKDWEGVGTTIAAEFDDAIVGVGDNFDSILSNTKKQCDQLKSGIKKTFDEVKSGTKKAMIEVNATITDQFSKAVSAVKKAGDDLKSNLQTTLNNIASGIKKSFDSIKTNMTTSFTQAASSVQKALNECKSKISSTLTSVNSDVSSKTNSIKNNIENNFRNVKSSLTKPFDGVAGTLGRSLDSIKSTISGRLDSIVAKINSSVSSMKKAMDFTFPKPYLRLPHINVRGDWNFETKQVPKFSVQWYAKGGIMTNPTAFGMNGNNLMVGGEAGPEAILPLDTLFDKMNDMFDNQNRTIANTLANNTHNTGPVTLIMEMDGEKVAKGTVKNMQDLARIGALDMTWL